MDIDPDLVLELLKLLGAAIARARGWREVRRRRLQAKRNDNGC